MIALLTSGLYAVNLILLLAFHVLNRQYSPVSNAVSDYGVGPTARLFQIYVTVGTFAALGLAWVVWHARPALPSAVTYTLLAMAAARVGVGVFPTDLPGTPKTLTGRLHLLAAVLTFTFAYMTIAKATPLLQGTSTLLGPLHIAAMVGLAAVVITLVGPLRPVFGLAERLFLFATAIWFLVASLGFALA